MMNKVPFPLLLAGAIGCSDADISDAALAGKDIVENITLPYCRPGSVENPKIDAIFQDAINRLNAVGDEDPGALGEIEKALVMRLQKSGYDVLDRAIPPAAEFETHQDADPRAPATLVHNLFYVEKDGRRDAFGITAQCFDVQSATGESIHCTLGHKFASQPTAEEEATISFEKTNNGVYDIKTYDKSQEFHTQFTVDTETEVFTSQTGGRFHDLMDRGDCTPGLLKKAQNKIQNVGNTLKRFVRNWF